jgi:NAD(P)-dependent dehydrogenase (short-subunit alcohol dehydrogenase family)
VPPNLAELFPADIVYYPGIGLAIAKHLLSLPEQHSVFLISRTVPKSLRDLQLQYAERVQLFAVDLSHDASGSGAIEHVLRQSGGILDGLVVNHGILGDCKRIIDSTWQGWEQTFHANFFSVVDILSTALPALRRRRGRIVFTSSGAAQSAYSSWGAYGASKAALNHLAMTLKNEEPYVTTICIEPGVVDSDMQKEIREVHHKTMDIADWEKFLDAKEKGTLLRPEQPGNVIAKLVVAAAIEFSGQFLSWNDEVLKDFQDTVAL